jgi:hypothetical protein
MKKILVFCSLFSFLSFTSCQTDNNVEIGKKTEMKVNAVYKDNKNHSKNNPMVFNAGKITKGQEINATFKVTNTGKSPLILTEVKGSCTCTVADFPKKPIAAGESAEIKAIVKTDKTGDGPISKSIRIIANTAPDALTVVYVKALVEY